MTRSLTITGTVNDFGNGSRGTSFSVYLPLIVEIARPAPPAQREVGEDGGNARVADSAGDANEEQRA